MSDQDEKKTLDLGRRAQRGQVKQSFSHGRTKSVVVETKRKRVFVPKSPGNGTSTQAEQKTGTGSQETHKASTARQGAAAANELERRRKALEAARGREEQEKAVREKELREREAEREERRAALAARAEAEERAQEQKKRLEDEKKAEAKPPAPTPPADAGASKDLAKPTRSTTPPAATTPSRKQERPERPLREQRNKGADERRRAGKLTLNQALSGVDGGRQRSLASVKRQQERARKKAMGIQKEAEKIIRDVQLPEVIVVQELANRMAERVGDVVKALVNNGIMVTQNQPIDADTAELIITEFGHRVQRVSDADVESVIDTVKDDAKDLKPRPPIITVMGHVDHGKTSLLDAIRSTKVVASEAGGITQHIGAYQVLSDTGDLMTFLDTPGHAAFTSMRARGANVTDIVILVVAADDAVMPQTIEAINHAKAAQVPIIVAINKIDAPEADPDKVRTKLLQHEIIVEKMSGDVLDVEVSATNRTGLEKLLENISLQAELLELTANPNRAAQGAIIEAQLDVGRGPVATVLVQNGTLRRGDIFVVGEQWGKVRALVNDKGEIVKEASPSVPVEVLGLNGTPKAGDVLNVVETEAQAREIAEYRINAAREARATIGAGSSLEQLMAKAKDKGNRVEFPLVVKADVQGSAEAIVQAMEKIGNEEVGVRILHSGVGAITESDIGLAEASGAPAFGFNVRANATARSSANQKNVEIRYYSVIYDLVNDVKAAASGLLSAEMREKFIGNAEIKEVFKVSGVGRIAGCLITEGVARRSAGVRLLRDNVVIHEGTLKTLKRFKDEVPEVQSGQECGMAFENYEDIRQADVIEIFEREERARTL